MFNILDILENLVTSKIISNGLTSATEESFEECLSMAKTEQEKIKKMLLEIVFNLSCEEHTCLFFNHFHVRLINLSNLLYENIGPDFSALEMSYNSVDSSDSSKISFLNLIDDLLSHLEYYFSKFLNSKCIISNKLRDIAIKQFECFLSDLDDLNGTLPNNFIQIISEPVKLFISSPQFATYANFDYLSIYITDLLNVIQQSKTKQLVSLLKTKLLYLNFNSIGFFNYITDEINEEISEIDTSFGKIEKLAYFLKEIKQLPFKTSIGYSHSRKTIHDLVSYWIIEEICYLEKGLHLSDIQIKSPSNSIITDFKIITGLSVPQLAYFTKILVDTGILKKQNDRELIKFISGNTRSKQADSISSESLRVKYYSVEVSTKNEIKDILIKLLNHINKSKILMFLLYLLLDCMPEEFYIAPLTFCS